MALKNQSLFIKTLWRKLLRKRRAIHTWFRFLTDKLPGPIKKAAYYIGRILRPFSFLFSWKFLLSVFVVASLSVIFYVMWVVRDLPTVETFRERQIAESTILYDSTGETILYDIHGNEKRRVVPLDEISPNLIDAAIVAEDDNFYSHFGIDPMGILRSIFVNVREGSRVQGGSTITQQLVRNAVLTPEKTYERKIREAVLSIALEFTLTKNEILEAYFNQIPYGSLIYGAEAASQTFFGKPVNDLSLAQAATLAAIPKAPSYYSPYGNRRDELYARKNFIIDRMFSLGYISAEEREQARTEDPEFQVVKDSIIAPHFVFYVQEELERRFGKVRVEQGGLRVVTSLNLDYQEIAERAVSEGAEKNKKRYGGENAALISIDPNTGAILAMVGSRDYFDETTDGNVNVTTRQRQPGSSFKPVVYAAAFEKGYTPDTILFDVETNFGVHGAKEYIPQNYNGKFYGPLTVRQALANSLNVPAVKMLYLVGVRDAITFAEKLGFTTLTDPNRYGLSLVLGGGEITLLEETSAFGVFAADGLRAAPESILKVEDSKGDVLYEYNPEPSRVIRKEIARQITDILSDNSARSIAFGTRTPLVLSKRPAAAKTGTTQFYNDAWTIGYTPSLVTGVWVGNNDNSSMRPGAAGSVVAAPIWNQFMSEALKDTPVESFAAPKPLTTGKPILDGEWAAPQIIKIDRATGKLATEYTPPEYIEERAFGTVHDTLFWVDRSDPRGPAPEDPYQDPQFKDWERGVLEWFSKNGGSVSISTELPPTEEDDIHTPENEPMLNILLPAKNATIENSFTIVISAKAPLGIKTITYSLEGSAFGSLAPEANTRNLYSREVFLPSVEDVSSKVEILDLTVRAFDPYGNRIAVTIPVRVRLPETFGDENEESTDDDTQDPLTGESSDEL